MTTEEDKEILYLMREVREKACEVTELVDGKAIQAHKNGSHYEWADWSKEKFITSLESLISRKDLRFPDLKEPPYDGGYF